MPEYRILTRTYPPAALTSFEVHLSTGSTKPLKKEPVSGCGTQDGSVERRGVTVLDRTPQVNPGS